MHLPTLVLYCSSQSECGCGLGVRQWSPHWYTSAKIGVGVADALGPIHQMLWLETAAG